MSKETASTDRNENDVGQIKSDMSANSVSISSPSMHGNILEHNDRLMVYFMRRRDVLIAELREIDRLLGRPQTVPVAKERQR